jgi:glycosyltransferase involved in cell wall biosynthesis
MNKPRVSVIIPTFNRPLELRSCLNALDRQTFSEEWEIIVVDDGSPRPVEIGEPYCSETCTWKLIRQANAGPAVARNRGARESAGEFVAFTDDDCLPDPTWLEKLMKRAEQSKRVLVGGTTYNGLMSDMFAHTSQLIVDLVYEHFNADSDNAYFLASNNILCTRRCFDEIGGFSVEYPRPGAEDRDFCDQWRSRGWQIVWERNALIEHRHAQSHKKFIELHFRYGRGAFLYQSARKKRNSGTMEEDLSFHSSLPMRVTKRLKRNTERFSRWLLLAALLEWQIANAAGFFWEWLLTSSYLKRKRHLGIHNESS